MKLTLRQLCQYCDALSAIPGEERTLCRCRSVFDDRETEPEPACWASDPEMAFYGFPCDGIGGIDG